LYFLPRPDDRKSSATYEDFSNYLLKPLVDGGFFSESFLGGENWLFFGLDGSFLLFKSNLTSAFLD